MRGAQFDAAYYDRFYRNPRTRVYEASDVRKLCGFVVAYIAHLDIPVRRVVDLGCGLGYWQEALEDLVPKASYTGVEISEYLCEEYGWDHASVAEFRGRGTYDLVVCQGVLQYLDDQEAERALDNLARLCRGALYLETLTEEDWAENCDRSVTDGSVHLRPAAFYRERLEQKFLSAGGGVFLQRETGVVLYELEKGR